MDIPPELKIDQGLNFPTGKLEGKEIVDCKFFLQKNQKGKIEIIFKVKKEDGSLKEFYYQSQGKLSKILSAPGDLQEKKQALKSQAETAIAVILKVKEINKGKSFKRLLIKKIGKQHIFKGSKELLQKLKTHEEEINQLVFKNKISTLSKEEISRVEKVSSTSYQILAHKKGTKTLDQQTQDLVRKNQRELRKYTSKESFARFQGRDTCYTVPEGLRKSLQDNYQEYKNYQKKFGHLKSFRNKDELLGKLSLNLIKHHIRIHAYEAQENEGFSIPCHYRGLSIPTRTWGTDGLDEKDDPNERKAKLYPGRFNGTSKRDLVLEEVGKERTLHPKHDHLLGITEFVLPQKILVAHGCVRTEKQKDQLVEMFSRSYSIEKNLGKSISGTPRNRIRALSLLDGSQKNDMLAQNEHENFIKDKEFDNALNKRHPEANFESVFLHFPKNVGSKSSSMSTSTWNQKKWSQDPLGYLKGSLEKGRNFISSGLARTLGTLKRQDTEADKRNNQAWITYIKWTAEELSLLCNEDTDKEFKDGLIALRNYSSLDNPPFPNYWKDKIMEVSEIEDELFNQLNQKEKANLFLSYLLSIASKAKLPKENLPAFLELCQLTVKLSGNYSSSREQQEFMLNRLDTLLGVSETVNCQSSCDRTALATAQSLALEHVYQLYQKDCLIDLKTAVQQYDRFTQDLHEYFAETCKQKALEILEEDEVDEIDILNTQVGLFENYIASLLEKQEGETSQDKEERMGRFLAYQLQQASFHNLLTTGAMRNLRSTGVGGLKINAGGGPIKTINPHLLRLLPPYIRVASEKGQEQVMLLKADFGEITNEAISLIEGASEMRGKNK